LTHTVYCKKTCRYSDCCEVHNTQVFSRPY